jgi:GPH family glycoside/pentoside/hexuronide:cation symporter
VGVQPQRLSKQTLFYYSLADLPISMALFPVMVFIPRFYSAELGVSVTMLGGVMLVQRIIDLLADPLMGLLSDRTRSRFGRRKPWVAASAPLMMLGIYQLFFPPEGAGAWHLFGWGLVLGLSLTMLLIPYYAWGAELSPDYHERSRVSGARAMAGIAGSLAAQLAPSAAFLALGIGGDRSVLMIVGTTALVLMPLCVLATVTKTPDATATVATYVPLLPGLRLMSRNVPFLRLVTAFTIGSIGLSISTPLYAFFVADVLGAKQQATIMLTFFYLSSFAGVAFWVRAANRIGKHRAYVVAFAVISLAHPFYLLLGRGDLWWMLPVTVATGFASGGFSQLLPNAMKADVIDLDSVESGENRAAFFFSVWSFVQKLAGTIGGSLAMFGLGLFHYDATLGSGNDPHAMFGLRFLFSTFPSLFFVAGALIVWNFPITEERHREIRAMLEAKRRTPEAVPAVPNN